jgi:TolB-like protein/tRNA A-37 threonylcarbamoyl transferase component Bud32/Flp pilus assembly protein TadD
MDDHSDRLAAALADRYRLERELGAGGMATVYLAHDLKHDRKVAVKVLKPELAAVLGAERFLAEIKVTANLQHPNLLPLFDSGQADGFLYYVMPYVQGETLRARLERERQLSVDETIRLVTLLANALAYAHAQGVIHRDLKPENILLQSGQPVIADFGIALAVAQAGGARVTETGLSLGTPHYMSPEQAAGERELDARSDQYALAAVTYEMLSGEPPHTGPTAQVIVARLMTEQVRSLRATRPGVPVAVDRAVGRALAKTPADRFDTVTAFVAALTGPADPAPSQSGRRALRWLLLPAAGLAIALALFTMSRLRAGQRAGGGEASDNLRVVAVLPFRNISQDTAQRYFSAGMTEEIATQLSRVAALRVLGRAATAQYDTAGDRLQRMSRELGVGSVVDGSVRLAGNRVRIAVELTSARTGQSLWAEQYDRQLSDLFAVQDDVAHKVTAALQATLTPAEAKRVAHVPTTNMAAYQLYLRAVDLSPTRRSENISRAELLGQAIRMDSGFPAAFAELGRTYMFRSVAGERAYTDSGFIAARKAIALDPELADGWFALGDLESVVLKLSDARRSYLKALELNPSHGGAMADLANVYVALGRFDEALDWALRNQQLNPNQPHAPYHVSLSLIQLDDDSATARFLLDAERRMPTELRVQGMLAWLDLRRGSNPAAIERARRLVRNEPDNTEGPPILAELAVVVGDSDAGRLIEPLARQDPKAAGQMFPESLRSLHALTLHRQGDTRHAAELWRESGAAARQSLEAGAEGYAAPMELAAINAIEGHTDAALEWLERGYRAGWKDARLLGLDPFFASVRREPRYLALTAGMRQDVAEMRKRAAAAHPELFTPPPGP